VSCDEGGDPDPGATKVVDMAGDWYVQTFIDGEMIADYSLISTYNTASDDGTEIWIDDNKNIYWFKLKSPVNTSSKTFSGMNLASSVVDDDTSTPDVIETYDINVNVTNGTIVKDGATTSGGNTSDSISFDAEFSDDPGTIYQFRGYKRTGLLEDEH
jgi:hypothetical protein